MSQPSFCEDCEIVVSSDSCSRCGMPPQIKSEEQLESIASPGDKTSVLLKRYKISERKRITPFPGFNLYSNKNDGNGWKIVEELEEIAGKSNWRKWLFGKEENGFVYYLNTLSLPIKFEWFVPFNGEKYRVKTTVEIKVLQPEFFITQNQGRESILLDEVASSLEGSAKERLKNSLAALNAESIDFARCQTDIHARCQSILGDKGLDIISVTMSGEIEVDLVLKRLEEDKMKATQQRELLTHQSTEENLTEQHVDNKTTETALLKSDNSLKLELKEIKKRADIRKEEAKAELEALEEEWLVKEGEIKIGTKAEVAQTQGKTEVAVVEIKGAVELEKEGTILDGAKNNRAVINVDHALALHKKSTVHFSTLKQKNENQDTDNADKSSEKEEQAEFKPSEILQRFSEIITIENTNDVICQSDEFGEYFWEKLTSTSSELKYLLNNETLHYVRYEENYCYSIDEIIFLHQTLTKLKQFSCFNKAYSETHLIFGFKKQTMANMAQPFGRNKLLEQLSKPNGHCSVSIKNKIHDREMGLVFNNGAHVRIKLSFGFGFWLFDKSLLPSELLEKLQTPIDYKDITPDLVASIKQVNLPVQNKKHEKDTTISLWGYKPVTL